MRTIEIDGNAFNSLDGFYRIIEKHLIEGDCPWGENLNSLDEIVLCSFNYTDDSRKDIKKITWLNFDKSTRELTELVGGRKVIDILDEIFSSNENIEFIK